MQKIGKKTNEPFLKFCLVNRWVDGRTVVNSGDTFVSTGVQKYSFMAGILISAVNSHIFHTYIWQLKALESIVHYVHSNHGFPFDL